MQRLIPIVRGRWIWEPDKSQVAKFIQEFVGYEINEEKDKKESRR